MVETMKAKTNVLTERMKNQTSLLETLLREDRERDRIEVDAHIRMMEIEAKHDKDLDEGMIKLIMDRGRRDIEVAKVQSQVEMESARQDLARISAEQQPQSQPQPQPGASPNG